MRLLPPLAIAAAIYIMLLLGIYDSLAKLSGFLGLTQKCSALCCGAAADAPGTQWEPIEKPPAKGVRCAKGVEALVKGMLQSVHVPSDSAAR